MAIDAIVDRVEYAEEGCILHLKDREHRSRGQSQLTVIDPPKGLEALQGMAIWGGSDECLMGKDDKLIFDRIGYTRLRLRPKKESK